MNLGRFRDEPGNAEVVHGTLQWVLEHLEPLGEDSFGSGHQPLRLNVNQVSLRNRLFQRNLASCNDAVVAKSKFLDRHSVLLFLE